MRTLFLRIFVYFWVAMTLILVCAIGVTATVVWIRYSELDGVNAAELVTEASQALRLSGQPGLESWLNSIVRDHPSLDVYIVDDAGNDVLHRRIPERIENWLLLGGRPMKTFTERSGTPYNWPYGYDWAPSGIAPHELTFNRSHLLANPTILGADGATYTMIVAWLGASPIDAMGSHRAILALLLIAFGGSALVCWWIARHISEPITRLQSHARAMALGTLDTKIEPVLQERADELGALSRALDQMVQRIRSQVQSKETLIRDISHELRSPLTRLRVALELARRRTEDTPIHLSRMERELERMDAMIEEMLQLSRLAGKDPAFSTEQLDLSQVVDDLVEDALIEATNSGKTIQSHVSTPLPVRGNPILIYRAIDNVVRNAIRYAPNGSVIRVNSHTEGGKIIISIEDQGPGVPDCELPRIFDAFHRVSEARERDSGGTGLGLAITAWTMLHHHGFARAKNAIHGGLIVELGFVADITQARSAARR